MFNLLNKSNQKSPVSQKQFEKIKDKILGKNYELSAVLIDNKQSRQLNKKNRQKNKPANVLSFPLEKNTGEIFLDLQTKKESKQFKMSYKKYLTFLFIHGCLHLKGFDHGEKMERQEDALLKIFSK